MALLRGGTPRFSRTAKDETEVDLRDDLRAIERKIKAHKATVGVIGQGYVGFPLAQRAAEVGFPTIGFDVSGATVQRCEKLNRFDTYQAVSSAIALTPCDVLIVAVPTPTKEDGHRREPDLTFVINAVRTLLTNIDDSRPRLVILESTYAPGTTRNVVAPMIEAKGWLGSAVLLGYSPERIDPGNERFTIINTPKITSGHDEATAYLVNLFYAQVVDRAVPASSLEAAEATKILENTFRFINITFAHEFEGYCEAMGMDAREITTLASTKPFGFMPFFAGPGIGGHCIAEDPYYLYQSIVDNGMGAPILKEALYNHEHRAQVIVDRVNRHLAGKPLRESRVLILGVTYKPNVGDPRQSPAQPIIELLEEEGVTVEYHDALVGRFCGRTSIDLASADPADYDLAVLVTDHKHIDYTALIEAGWRIYDTKGVIKMPKGARANVIPLRRSTERAGAVLVEAAP